MKKLENLLNFKDFSSNWDEKSTKTKRTGVAKDILNEDVEEIIPEGLPEDSETLELAVEEKKDEIFSKLEVADDGDLDKVIEYLRDVLTEMEQQGFIEEDVTDGLDDKHLEIGKEWAIDVINLPEFPEDAINGVLDILNGVEDVAQREIDDIEDNEDDIEDDFSLDAF